jgi:sec-independent protein translocase protein TatA
MRSAGSAEGIDMGDLSPWHIAILVVVLVLLFGARRLPGAARSLGESMHIFKQSVSGLHPDTEADTTFGAPTFTATAPVQPAQQLAQPDGTQAQLQDLQRQVEELQRQQTASGSAGQSGQPVV